MAQNKKILATWKERNKLRAEGNKLIAKRNKLWAKGDKLWAEGDKLRAEGYKLMAEGDKLRAESNKLRAEGEILFLAAVLEVYGNIPLEWKKWNRKNASYECHLSNGEVYGFKEQ